MNSEEIALLTDNIVKKFQAIENILFQKKIVLFMI